MKKPQFASEQYNLKVGYKLETKEDFANTLNDYIVDFKDVVAKALYQEGQQIMRKSKRQCPIDTGRLRASGRVTKPQQDSQGNIFIDLTYNTKYATYVHENLEAYHKPPTKAKYLEDPAREAMPALVENVVLRANKIMMKERAK